MSLESLLNERDNSISSKEILIRTLAETARELLPGRRYHAFPITHTNLPAPDAPPDRLNAVYPNEYASLEDMGVSAANEFHIVGGVGYQYKLPNGNLGYFIEYLFVYTIQGNDDISYALLRWGIDLNVDDVVTLKKQVDYTGAQFDLDWHIVEDDLI